MNSQELHHCRLCAEVKSPSKLIDTNTEFAVNRNIVAKLLSIQIDVTLTDPLPKAICFICFDSLEKSYTFVQSVKRAQEQLRQFFGLDEIEIKLEEPLEVKDEQDRTASRIDVNNRSDTKVDVFHVEIDEKFADDGNYDEDFNFECGNNSDADYVPKRELLLKPKKRKASKEKKKKYLKRLCAEKEDRDDIVYDWSAYPWQCYVCNSLCSDVQSLRTHWFKVHNSCTMYSCADCSKRIPRYNTFVSHVKKHRGYLKSSCDVCHVTFSSDQAMRKHRAIEHALNDRECPNCRLVFDSESSYAEHVETYVKRVGKARLKREKISEENGDYVCQLCDKKFKTRGNLQIHILIHTNRSRDYTCERCGKTFYNRGALTSHMLLHEDSKPHKCKICSSAFRTNAQLRSHVSIHGNNKPFSCEQCGRCFRLRTQLKSHAIIHTDSMPYTCSYCGKSFRFKTILTQHLRQHTGAKPYSCPICQRDFTNWPNFNKHMKRRHNITTAKKKLTPAGVFPIDPTTGDIVKLPVADEIGTEEWKKKILEQQLKPGRPKTSNPSDPEAKPLDNSEGVNAGL